MKIFFQLAVVCSCALTLAGTEPALTTDKWYISFPEKNGIIKASETGYLFNKDGSVTISRTGRAAENYRKLITLYKRNTGKDYQEPELSWKWENGKLRITAQTGTGTHTFTFISSGNPQILLPENKQSFILLARKGAKFSPEQAAQFWKAVHNANRDTFADDLKLPENVQLAEPEKQLWHASFTGTPFHTKHWKDAPANSFQHRVLSAIGRGAELPDDAKCDIPSLTRMFADSTSRAVLMQYLACHPQWRLYPESDNSLHAVRYFCTPEGKIRPTLHQYYAVHNTDTGKKTPLEFQFRFDIGFSGKAWNRAPIFPRNKTERRSSTEWETRFFCGKALVNIFDQTRFPGRQMTKAALDFTEEEFAALSKNQDDWNKLLPPGSIRHGKPDLILYDDMQGGIYAAHLWCNPGEKGTVYLKAFEITKGTPLSVTGLKARTRNVSGWSNDPRQQFCTGMYFTIYEGEWEQFYGARFEVWFVQDSGGAERKLLEKNYKIQGWTR